MSRMQWQPIETAPRDGTAVLLTDGFDVAVARWEDTGMRFQNLAWVVSRYIDGEYNSTVDFDDPTHWMPLPPKPSSVA
jgi:hypothetical protein